jgi:hypothetical protein
MQKKTNIREAIWTETKKDFEIDNTGNSILKRVTKEADVNRRYRTDTIFKIAPFVGLIITILIFYFGQRADKEKEISRRKIELGREKGKLQIEYYSDLSFQLHTLFQKPLSKREIDSLEFKILYQSYRKVTFLNDSAVTEAFKPFVPQVQNFITSIEVHEILELSPNITDNIYWDVLDLENIINAPPVSNRKLISRIISMEKNVNSLSKDESNLAFIFFSKFKDFAANGKYIDTTYNNWNDIKNKPIERQFGYYLFHYRDLITSFAGVTDALKDEVGDYQKNKIQIERDIKQLIEEINGIREMNIALLDFKPKYSHYLDSLTNNLDDISRQQSWLYKE